MSAVTPSSIAIKVKAEDLKFVVDKDTAVMAKGATHKSLAMKADGKSTMHVTLQIGDQVLQGADAPPGQFTKPAGFCVAVHFDDAAEGERVFGALAQEGKVQMPFQATFWAKGFGMLIDQFGTPWIVNAGQATAS